MPLHERSDPAVRPRGRPSKFGRPSRVVTVTLPDDAIARLRRVHHDIGWAIMALLDQGSRTLTRRRARGFEPDVDLVRIAERRALIVVNSQIIRHLPGIRLIPLNGNRAFVALDVDQGMSDLELAVSDRLDEPTLDRDEAKALTDLRAHLTRWRRDHALRIHRHAIIVVERRRHGRVIGKQAQGA